MQIATMQVDELTIANHLTRYQMASNSVKSRVAWLFWLNLNSSQISVSLTRILYLFIS
jgi:hypothetical protein